MNERDRLAHLSPEDEEKSQSLQENIKSLLSNPRENLLKINSIVRDSSQRLLLPPDMLREVFETLRRIHREETEKSLDRGDTGAIKGYVSEQLNQVSNGYNELFKNLQGHIESLGPLNSEAESVINLQDEVGEAEQSIQQLLKSINSVGQMPELLQQDMPPTSSLRNSNG